MAEIQMSQMEYDKRIDKIKRCGENRGPHDYIPLSFKRDAEEEFVTMFICRNCFTRVSANTLYEHFPEAKV